MFNYKTYNKPLYHGSKGGIEGEISVKSPNKNRKDHPCDFGDGFYIGTSKEQAEGVCIEDAHPVLYTVEVDFKQIPDEKILTLNNEQWLYTVLACRKKSEGFSNTTLAVDICNIINSYDIVIGTIADDRMNNAIQRFNQNNITTIGLEKCLEFIDYGTQIVIKSQEKVNNIVKLLSNKLLKGFEANHIRECLRADMEKSWNIVNKMAVKYRRDGLILDEIIQMAECGKLSAKDIFPEYYQVKRGNRGGGNNNDQDGTNYHIPPNEGSKDGNGNNNPTPSVSLPQMEANKQTEEPLQGSIVNCLEDDNYELS